MSLSGTTLDKTIVIYSDFKNIMCTWKKELKKMPSMLKGFETIFFGKKVSLSPNYYHQEKQKDGIQISQSRLSRSTLPEVIFISGPHTIPDFNPMKHQERTSVLEKPGGFWSPRLPILSFWKVPGTPRRRLCCVAPACRCTTFGHVSAWFPVELIFWLMTEAVFS